MVAEKENFKNNCGMRPKKTKHSKMFIADEFVPAKRCNLTRIFMPNEIYHNVLSFLNRSFLERNVQIVSRHMRAIVASMTAAPYLNAGTLSAFVFYARSEMLGELNFEVPPGHNNLDFMLNRADQSVENIRPLLDAPLPLYIRFQGLCVTAIWASESGVQDQQEREASEEIVTVLRRVRHAWCYPGCAEDGNGSLQLSINGVICMRRIIDEFAPNCSCLMLKLSGFDKINIFNFAAIKNFEFSTLVIESADINDGETFNKRHFHASDVVEWLTRGALQSPNPDQTGTSSDALLADRAASELLEKPRKLQLHSRVCSEEVELKNMLASEFKNSMYPMAYFLVVSDVLNASVNESDQILVESHKNKHTGEKLSIFGANPDKFYAIQRHMPVHRLSELCSGFC